MLTFSDLLFIVSLFSSSTKNLSFYLILISIIKNFLLQEKIEELQEKMRKREERIDREFQEKERERIKIAREKARYVWLIQKFLYV